MRASALAVVANAQGRSDFGALQRALREDPQAISYFAFDCLVADGEALTGLDNLARKQRLGDQLRNASPPIFYAEHVLGDGDAVAASACRGGLESVIAKRASAPYRSARVKSWLKIKCVKEQEFVIGGWSPSTGNHPFSSLLLGAWRGDRLVYAGRVGTGFDDDQLKEIAAKLRRRALKTSPFEAVSSAVRRGARWVSPDLVAQVRYAELTGEGRVRHASSSACGKTRIPRTCGSSAPGRPKK